MGADITKFMNYVNMRHGVKVETYEDLQRYSVRETATFWKTVWEFTDIKYSRKYENVVHRMAKFPPYTKWFPGSKINFPENLLRNTGDGKAISLRNESREERDITHDRLIKEVHKIAEYLRGIGIVPGDKIVGYMSNITETIVAMLES